MVVEADFIIIGAGAAGLLLVDELCQQAQKSKVIVLEAETQPAYHASGRSAAIFVPSYGHGLLRDLTASSRRFFEDADAEYFPFPLFSSRGILRLVLRGGEAQYREIIEDMPGIETLSVDAAVDYFPLINPEKIVAASFERDAPEIDAHALLQGAAKRAQNYGAEFIYDSRVKALDFVDNGWNIQTKNQNYRAPVVINAAGSWANEIASLAKTAPLDMVPCRRSFAILPMPEELAGNTDFPFTVTSPLRWYAKPQGGRLLISPADENEVTPHDVMADDMVIAEGLQRFSDDTGYTPHRVESTMAGIRMITADEYPAVGFDDTIDGFFWLAGQCGFGIQCAPGLAKLATKILLQDRQVRDDLVVAFDANRLRISNQL